MKKEKLIKVLKSGASIYKVDIVDCDWFNYDPKLSIYKPSVDYLLFLINNNRKNDLETVFETEKEAINCLKLLKKQNMDK